VTLRLPTGKKLDLGDTYHGDGCRVRKDWTSIALDSDPRGYVRVEISPEEAERQQEIILAAMDAAAERYEFSHERGDKPYIVTRDMIPDDLDDERARNQIGKWVGDYNHMPLEWSGRFVAAFGSCYLEERVDWHELFRVLASGAIVIVGACESDYTYEPDRVGGVHHCDPEEVIRDAREAGFKLVRRAIVDDHDGYCEHLRLIKPRGGATQ